MLNQKKWKIVQKSKRGHGLGHLTYILNFVTPNISGTAEDTHLKMCTQIGRKGY